MFSFTEPIAPSGFTRSISGTGMTVSVTLNWLPLPNYNCDFNFVLIVNNMTNILMSNVTTYTVPSLNFGQSNTFTLYYSDSTGYTSTRVAQTIDANREHVHVNLIVLCILMHFHLLNCAAPPAVTFDRVTFVPSGDNFNIRFYWNVSSFYKFMVYCCSYVCVQTNKVAVPINVFNASLYNYCINSLHYSTAGVHQIQALEAAYKDCS